MGAGFTPSKSGLTVKRRLSADVVNPQVDLPKRTSGVGGTRVGFLVRQAARTDSERRESGFPQAGGENYATVNVVHGAALAASWVVFRGRGRDWTYHPADRSGSLRASYNRELAIMISVSCGSGSKALGYFEDLANWCNPGCNLNCKST